MRTKQQGMTFFEVMLVIVVVGVLMTMSIRQYLIIKNDADVEAVINNVNNIFQGMGNYYRAECYGKTTLINTGTTPPTPNLVPGALYPTATPPSQKVVTIDVMLKTPGYMTGPLPLNKSSLVDTTTRRNHYNGYVAQFNLYRNGNSFVYTEQVAVLLKDTTNAAQWRRYFGADCLSKFYSLGVANFVYSCKNVSCRTGSCYYLVWERMPSLSGAPSTMWSIMPVVRQFTNRYNKVGDYTLCGS